MQKTSFVWLLTALLLAVIASTGSGQAWQPAAPLTEERKIELLIDTVSKLTNAVFIRNGTEYDGAAAASHMRTKWKAGGSSIKTAGDFIRLAGSVSSMSGKPYMIRFRDGRELSSAEFLSTALRSIEAGTVVQTQPATASATAPATMPAASQPADDANPAAEGFDLAGSDPRAIELADLTMRAMGGRRAWDRTRFITWKFLGRRTNVWDKQTGNVRIELGDPGAELHQLILMNINTRKGRAWSGGREVTDSEELKAVLGNGLIAWQNDSYWIFMPYKLKDNGVTLKHLGPKKLEDGRDAERVQLMFKDVPRLGMPHDRYEVLIANDTQLVSQWSYFEGADDLRPKFTQPWSDWKRYGSIMLSEDRGPGRRHSNVYVFDELPESVFTSPEPFDAFLLREKALPIGEMTPD